MRYYDILITPEDLLDPNDPLKLINNRAILNTACISVTMELRPLELLEIIHMIGSKNVKLQSFKYSTEEELCSDTHVESIPEYLGIDHSIDGSKEVSEGVATMAPFGARVYTCKLLFRGETILRFTGFNTSEVCYYDDKTPIVNAEKAILGFMAEVYNSIFHNLSNKDTDKYSGLIYDHEVYGGVRLKYDGFSNVDGTITPPKIPVSVHYIVGPNDSVDLYKNQVINPTRIRKLINSVCASGSIGVQGTMVNVIYNATIPIAYIPMVYLFKPSWATILQHDRISAKISCTGGDKEPALSRIYTTMPESSPIDLVILVDLDDALRQGVTKNYNIFACELYKNIVDVCRIMYDI